MKTILKFCSLIIFLAITFSPEVYGQCQGPVMTPIGCNSNIILLQNDSLTSIGPFEIGADGEYEFYIYQHVGEVYIVPGVDLSIYSTDGGFNFYDFAAVIPEGTDISSLPDADFSGHPLFMFHEDGFGPWGGGTSGFLGFRTGDGRYGYIELLNTGEVSCAQGFYHFIIEEIALGRDPGAEVVAGVCPSEPIPTVGQWGVMILGLLLIITGLNYVRSTQLAKS